MSVAFLILSINALLTMIIGAMVWKIYNIALYAILLLLTTLSFLLFFIAHAGYQANLIPFGLDQLLEAPSASLALFIHWIIWADSLGMLIIQVLFGGLMCKFRSEYSTYLGCSLILILTACFLLIVICLRRHCFFSELVHHNPYKMVIMVLNFARKHSHLALIASIQNSLSLCWYLNKSQYIILYYNNNYIAAIARIQRAWTSMSDAPYLSKSIRKVQN